MTKPEVNWDQFPSFESFIKTQGILIPVVGDGNCLYSCIAYFVHGNTNEQQTVRKEIAQVVDQNPDLFQHYFAPGDDEEAKTFPEKVQLIRTDGKWGDEMSIAAAAIRYRCVFRILQWMSPVHIIPTSFDPLFPVYTISYHDGNHYNIVDTSCNNSGNQDSEMQIERPEDDHEMTMQEENLSQPLSHSQCNDFNYEGSVEQSQEDHCILDSSQHSEGNDLDSDDNLLESYGNKFIGAKTMASGRGTFSIFIIVPKVCRRHSFQESLELCREHGLTVPYSMSYGRTLYKLMRRNKEVTDLYDFYLGRKQIPLTSGMHKPFDWSSEICLPHLLLSALNHKPLGVKFQIIGASDYASSFRIIATHGWTTHRDKVMKVVQECLAHSVDLFCYNCNEGCNAAINSWHINLTYFTLVPIIKGGNKGRKSTPCIMKKSQIFGKAKIPPQIHALKALQRFNQELKRSDRNKSAEYSDAEKLFADLDEVNKVDKTCFYTYVLLLADGPDMTWDKSLDEILTDKTFYKLFYVGHTRNKRVRDVHFRKNSSRVSKFLSITTHVYLIRSQKFNTLGHAVTDEAQIIEMLKGHAFHAYEEWKSRPYILLNVNSENQSLLSTNRADWNVMKKFMKRSKSLSIHDVVQQLSELQNTNSVPSNDHHDFRVTYLCKESMIVYPEFHEVAEYYKTEQKRKYWV